MCSLLNRPNDSPGHSRASPHCQVESRVRDVSLGLIAAFAGAAVPAVVSAEVFNLACQGIAARPATASTYGTAFGSNGASAVVSGATAYRQESPDTLTVEISGNGGRIRVPLGMMPTLHAGGHDGWWTLERVVVGEREITASFSLNFLNKPHLRIDRSLGEISITGFSRSGFRGTCAPFDPDPAARRF